MTEHIVADLEKEKIYWKLDVNDKGDFELKASNELNGIYFMIIYVTKEGLLVIKRQEMDKLKLKGLQWYDSYINIILEENINKDIISHH